MINISLRFGVRAKSMTDFFRISNRFFLLCLLFSAGAQAASSWPALFSHSLEKLLQSNPQNLLELDQPAVLDFYSEGNYKSLWSDAKGPLNRAYD